MFTKPSSFIVLAVSLSLLACGEVSSGSFEVAPAGSAGSAQAGASQAGAGQAGQSGAGQAGAPAGLPGAPGNTPADACEAGEVLGCASASARRVCGEGGAVEVVPCPELLPICAGQGQCLQCLSDSDCPASADACGRPWCQGGLCLTKKVAQGEPVSGAKGPCLRRECDGEGHTVELPAPAGTPCEGSVCDGAGHCGGCAPGSRRCLSEGAAQRCDELGSWVDEACGGDAPLCSEGECGGVVGVKVGQSHSCALSLKGEVFCWGDNQEGQLGLGAPELGSTRSKPARIQGLSGVVQIALGASHSCALKASGEALCWGKNGQGQLGNGSTVSAPGPSVIAKKSYAQIAAAGAHSCGVTAEGAVECWGSNEHRESGSMNGVALPSPHTIEGLSGVEQLALGASHGCALKAGKTLCWGSNEKGQLGVEKIIPLKQSATPVPLFASFSAEAIAAGGLFSAAKVSGQDGKVRGYLWGQHKSNLFAGEEISWSPGEITWAGEGLLAVAAGGDAVGLLFDGWVRLFGGNAEGQLGAEPKEAALIDHVLPGVAGLALGPGHGCGFQKGGKVWCWGRNERGQLGVGQPTELALGPIEVQW